MGRMGWSIVWGQAMLLGVSADNGRAASAATGWEVVSAALEQGGTAMRVVTRNGRVMVIHILDQQTGFDAPQISQDRRSVGWSVLERVDASYSIEADFDVFRDGKPMPGISMDSCGEDGGVATGFSFWAGGEQIAIGFSFPHGVPYRHEQLYDVATGRCLGSVDFDNRTGKLPADAPAWAR